MNDTIASLNEVAARIEELYPDGINSVGLVELAHAHAAQRAANVIYEYINEILTTALEQKAKELTNGR